MQAVGVQKKEEVFTKAYGQEYFDRDPLAFRAEGTKVRVGHGCGRTVQCCVCGVGQGAVGVVTSPRFCQGCL
jgi:hypothetical protein